MANEVEASANTTRATLCLVRIEHLVLTTAILRLLRGSPQMSRPDLFVSLNEHNGRCRRSNGHGSGSVPAVAGAVGTRRDPRRPIEGVDADRCVAARRALLTPRLHVLQHRE
jgi:hypothetical protein